MIVDARRLLAAFDQQLRGAGSELLPVGAWAERDGPLERIFGLGRRGFIGYRDLSGLDGAGLDDLIARQVRIYAERREAVEWKLYGHDRPDDLARRLRRAGFVPEDTETVVIAPVSMVAATPRPPEGVALREVTERQEFERIAALQEAVWGYDHSDLAAGLAAERSTAPDSLVVVIAEAAGEVVSAAWVRFPPATDFATLWGGTTDPRWRGRGIYRSLVAYRATLAARRGCRYLQVDASDNSRPILERLGFTAITTTTPFVWTPQRETLTDDLAPP
jgi:GNAT superfamily N-acetyltransferase